MVFLVAYEDDKIENFFHNTKRKLTYQQSIEKKRMSFLYRFEINYRNKTNQKILLIVAH